MHGFQPELKTLVFQINNYNSYASKMEEGDFYPGCTYIMFKNEFALLFDVLEGNKLFDKKF
jgi:hypothetical protein